MDADGFHEIVAAQGPGPALSAQVKGFNFDDVAVSALPGYDVTPFASVYGARLNLGDLTGDGSWDLLAGAGRDPSASSTVLGYSYDGASLTQLPGSFLPFTGTYGVNVAAGALGHF